MSRLFKKVEDRGPAPKREDAPEGRPTGKQTRLAYALRSLKFEDDEFGAKASRARSYAQTLDLTVASLGLKGEAIKNTNAYKAAATYYQKVTGKEWTQ